MASSSRRLDLRVAPITGRDYTAIDSAAQPLSVVENDLDPQSPPFLFHASFRGMCYNPLARILLVCDPIACFVRTFDVEICSDTELRVLPRGQIGEHGTGTGKFQCPVAVDVSSRGEIAVADFQLDRVAFFTGSGNALHYFGKTGVNRGEFRGVLDLKFTSLGHVAVVDSGNHRVQVMTTTGGVVLVVGRQGGRLGELASPCAIDIARNGDLFVCDSANKRVQRFSAKGKWLAMWGSKRNRVTPTPRHDATGIAIVATPLRSIFDSPCDVLLGLNGEVFVCDVGRQEILVLSDTGSCLHVIPMPDKPHWSPIAVCIVRNSLLVAARQAPPSGLMSSLTVTPLLEQPCNHKFVVFPPPKKLAVGKLSLWPWTTLLETISFLTYADAIHVRLVNRVCHRVCRILRHDWKLFPLEPGRATVTKHSQIQESASGRVAVVECFHKWGLRIFKPANRIRRHVMDFDAGFRNAVSSLFGPMYFYQHEDLLREVFRFYSTSADKLEIDQAVFVEIVTQIEEVRAGFLQWPQCPALRTSQQIPPIRTVSHPESATVASKLELVEHAQQHLLTRLLTKLHTL